MIITRTPFRISFFGGGTDYPIWYMNNRGAVLSTTIDKYCYINCRYLPPFFNYRYRIKYISYEETNSISDINNLSVKECIKFMNLDKSQIEMVHTNDMPLQSGMGSSSSFTVGFLNSLYGLKGNIVSKRKLAEDAINIEQKILNENVGSQDQVAAAFGGLNKIEFYDNEFEVYPMTIGKNKLYNLESHLMLFFTGLQRNASDIAKDQINVTSYKKQELNKILDILSDAIDVLKCDSDLTEFGKLLNESWMIKRKLTNKISNQNIDKIYNAAIKSGAIGGKLLGAGGGGCMLFYVDPENRDNVKLNLNDLIHIPFRFEKLGSNIIYYDNDNY